MSTFDDFMIGEAVKHNQEIADLLDERNTLRESKLQLEILLGWIDAHQTTLFRECCKCENNGDLCEFHAMLDDARKAAR